MMKYRLEISSGAKRDLKKIDRYHLKLISSWIDKNINNTENPREHGKALSENLKGLWSYRIGNYRVICEIKDSELVVIAVTIGHRREVYK